VIGRHAKKKMSRAVVSEEDEAWVVCWPAGFIRRATCGLGGGQDARAALPEEARPPVPHFVATLQESHPTARGMQVPRLVIETIKTALSFG
jgi:hypothetical protein